MEPVHEGMVKVRPVMSASGSNTGISLIDWPAPLSGCSNVRLIAVLVFLNWTNGCCCILRIFRSTFRISAGSSFERATMFLWDTLYWPESIFEPSAGSASAILSTALEKIAYFSTVPAEMQFSSAILSAVRWREVSGLSCLSGCGDTGREY